MATFRATLLAVSPCTLCLAMETVPGTFVSIFSGTCFTSHTRTSLPLKLSAILGVELSPGDTGTMLCQQCLQRLDGHDLLESRLKQVQEESVQVYKNVTGDEEANYEAPAMLRELGHDAPATCLACHAALSIQDNCNAFWEKTQFSLTTFSKLLAKLTYVPVQPGRAGGDSLCGACVTRLNRVDGLTERLERQSRLIVRQYSTARARSAAAAAQSDGSRSVSNLLPTATDEQLSLLSQLDSMLHQLSPDHFDDSRSPGADSTSPLTSPPAGSDTLGSPLMEEPPAAAARAALQSPYDPDSVLGAACDDPAAFGAESDADGPERLGESCGDGIPPGHGNGAEDDGDGLGVGALMAETVYSAPGSPSAGAWEERPVGPVRTIYVQLMAGGAAEGGGQSEKTRRPAHTAAAAAAAATAAVTTNTAATKVAQTVEVVRLGPTDRLVPRVGPYRKRTDQPAADQPPAEGQPPVKRGRGRPRKADSAAKRRHSILHRKLRYVTAKSLSAQASGAADSAVGTVSAPDKSAQAAEPSGTASVQVVGVGGTVSEQDRPPPDTTAATDDDGEDEDDPSEMEATSGQETDAKRSDAEGADSSDADWLGPAAASARTTHRRRLAEAMRRVNTQIAEKKLLSETAAAGEAAETAGGRRQWPAEDLLEAEESQEWAVTARSRRVNGLYVCEVCQSTHAMLRDLLKHEKTHKEAKFPCPMCNKTFTLPKLVRKHQKHHKVTTAYQCEQCGLKCRSQLVLLEHMHAHTGGEHFSCGVCQRTFASRQRYRTHVRSHAGRRPALDCGVCGRRFSGRPALLRHRQEHEEPRLPCPQPDCDRRFDTEKRLTHHLLQHVSGPPWRCTVCDKEFKTKYSLRDHTRGHSGERPFACELCAARFSLRSNLIMHVRYVHQNDRRYECMLCGKRFKRKRLLAYHEMAHQGTRPLQCPHCPIQMIYPEHLKQHLRTHSGEKPYRCDVCSKSFSRSDNLKAHMFTHSNKKPFECRQCGLGFMRKMSLLQHMEQLSHGEHPDDYVINRTLVTSELVPPEEMVHTLELVDNKDGRVVMLVKGDSQQEVLIPEGHFVTADGQQISETDASFLTSEVQYVTTDGQRVELIIDERAANSGDAEVDLVIEDGGQDQADQVDLSQLVLQGEQDGQLVFEGGAGQGQLVLQGEGDDGQLVLQGEGEQGQLVFQKGGDGEQIILRGSGEGDQGQLVLQREGEQERWVFQEAKDGEELVLRGAGQQLALDGTGGGEQLVLEDVGPEMNSGHFSAAVPPAGV